MVALLTTPVNNHVPRSSTALRSVQAFCGIFLLVIGICVWTQPTGVPMNGKFTQFSAKFRTSDAISSEEIDRAFTQGKPNTHPPPPPAIRPGPGVVLPPPDTEEYVAICLVIKNQSIDMPEFFIHHYHHHGIRRFYIYDDGSVPPLEEHPYVANYGIPMDNLNFTYIHPDEVEDRGNFQVDVYTDCVERFGANHKWMAFLDPDEFLEMRGRKPRTLLDWLKGWEKNSTVGAVGVHWLGHNSAGHLKQQPGDVRKAYTTCIGNDERKSNKHVKTFVRTDLFNYIENIHWAKTKNGTIEVAEHGDLIHTWMHTPISHDIWALHHYATKSREDYELKKSRHRVEGGSLSDWWWDDMHNSGNISCPELSTYVP